MSFLYLKFEKIVSLTFINCVINFIKSCHFVIEMISFILKN